MNFETILIIGFIIIVVLFTLSYLGKETRDTKHIDYLKKISYIKDSEKQLIALDKLLDSILKSKGVKGETLGERLKKSRKEFKNSKDYSFVWNAHKLRNRIVHELDHSTSSEILAKTNSELTLILKSLLK